MGGHAEEVDLTGCQFDEEEHIDSFEEHGVEVKKSQARIVWTWPVRNWRQVGPARRGAGSTPAWWSIFHTVLEATL